MTDTMSPALIDALAYLTEVHHDGMRPAEAHARLRCLQDLHPSINIDLLWEEEAYDGSVHYDLLLRRPGEGTVSLAYCPERALPWPLRGVQRWSEGHLMRVNGTVLKVAQAIACLDFIWDEAPVTDRLVNSCLVQAELERDPVDLSRDHLQQAMDAFRRRRRLYTAEETLGWMRRRGLTHEHLERLVADEAAVAALRDRVVADEVESYFEVHRASFDTAHVARCTFPDAARAQEALDLIRARSLDFYALAQSRFLAEPGRASQLFAAVSRGTTPSEFEERVFAAAPGGLVGPVQTDEGYAVVLVLALEPGRLDEPTRRKIKQVLFEEWLEERRRAAKIEWYWGDVERTSRAA